MDSSDPGILTQQRATGLVLAGLAGLAITACAPRRAEAPAPGPATTAPRVALPHGAREFEIDADASVVTIIVRRAGKLANFGHAHVVTSSGETGRAWLGATPDLSGFEVRVPVNEFVVDDPGARARAGAEFAAQVPEDARAGTRRNLLGPDVLDVARYPEIVVSSTGPITASPPPSVIPVRIVVRGMSLERDLPLSARIDAAAVNASGSFRILQSELGMTPFSILGGAIAVADEIEVRFEIVARQLGPAR